MAEQNKGKDQTKRPSGKTSTGGESQTGDPGRTPGTAEGEEKTVEEDLREKESGGQK